MTDMRMRADPATGYPGRTYRFYTGKPVYSFGYGLSYSNYSYEFSAESENTIYMNKSISLDAFKMSGSLSYDIEKMGSEACKKLKFSTVVGVKNHGPMDGKHPVLLFLRWPNVLHGRPMKQLIGFRSVHLKAGERADVKFVVSPCKHLRRTNVDGTKVLDQGSHFLMTGKKEYQISIIA